MFWHEDFSKRGKLLIKKLMLQVYNESRLKSSFCKFYGRYNDFAHHRPICWMICFISLCKIVISVLALTMGNPVYLISTKGARRVWPVSRRCLLLRYTWSYLRVCWGSVLPYTRICNCPSDNDYVSHIVIFSILYSKSGLIVKNCIQAKGEYFEGQRRIKGSKIMINEGKNSHVALFFKQPLLDGTKTVLCIHQNIYSDHLSRFHLTLDAWCLPPLDLLWRKQRLYKRHWISKNDNLTYDSSQMHGRNRLFELSKRLLFSGTRQANSNRNTGLAFSREKAFLSTLIYLREWLGPKWPHQKILPSLNLPQQTQVVYIYIRCIWTTSAGSVTFLFANSSWSE
jgi:hypothetical protein